MGVIYKLHIRNYIYW